MSDSDNQSSPKKEEMEVSENGDADKSKEEANTSDTKEEEPKKEEEEEEEEEEDDDDEDSPPLGLLERPVILTSGKREKKKVERLAMSVNLPSAERKKVDIQEGAGTKLGDCPRVEFKLNQIKAIDLKPLHRLLFNRAGSNTEVKRNIRQFSGFTFKKGDKEFDKRQLSMNKMTIPGLKQICEVLDIERSGTKAAIIDRILEFLLKPSSSGLKVPKKKKRKSKGSGAEGDKKGAKRKRTSKKKKEGKAKAKKDTVSDLSDSDEDEDDDEEEEKKEKTKAAKSASEDEEEEEEEEEEEDEEEEEPPKKKAKVEKKTPVKKTPAKTKKQNGKQEKSAKTEKKDTKKKKKSSISDSDESDSDDEPLAAKKDEPPSNSELKDLIKKILDGANLEEVTMKTVVKQVYEKFPSFDLTDRKDFIKSTVREIIS